MKTPQPDKTPYIKKLRKAAMHKRMAATVGIVYKAVENFPPEEQARILKAASILLGFQH